MNVLIVEDEFHTSSFLKKIIEKDKDFKVVGVIESITDAVFYLSNFQNNLDLLFFDIQLSDGHSFEIFRHIDVFKPVVFCTAFDEYSMEAIKNNGVDYILKPIDERDVRNSLIKYKKLLFHLNSNHETFFEFKEDKPKSFQQKYLSPFKDKTVVLKKDDISLFSLENEILYIYTFDNKKYPLFKKIEHIESVSDPITFYRINRQMIVNRESIVSFQTYFNRKVVLELRVDIEKKVVVSRLKVTGFKRWLENI